MQGRTWLPQMVAMAELEAYSSKACWQNWMTAFVASSTRPTLKRKLLMRVAPRFMGCTVKSSRLRPTFVQPLTVTTAPNANLAVQTTLGCY